MSPKEMLDTMREEAIAVGAEAGTVMEYQLRRCALPEEFPP